VAEIELRNRKLRSAVVDACTPQLLVHGHYHRRYTEHVGSTRVEGLGADGAPGSAMVLETAVWVPKTARTARDL
jgi:hypothetical protein